MDKQLRVVALVGSLRRDSYTRRVVNALRELAPQAMRIEIAPIGSLPLYNEDEETLTPPRAWQAFRDQVRDGHAVLFATPEYNRSIPGAMKNAIGSASKAHVRVTAIAIATVRSVMPGYGSSSSLRKLPSVGS